jgi:N-acetyl-beta-hexosaminidase
MVHFGGDEVITSCFNESPTIQQYMVENNLTDYDSVVSFHMNNTRNMLRNVNSQKVGVYWSNEDTYYQKYQDGDILVFWG